MNHKTPAAAGQPATEETERSRLQAIGFQLNDDAAAGKSPLSLAHRACSYEFSGGGGRVVLSACPEPLHGSVWVDVVEDAFHFESEEDILEFCEAALTLLKRANQGRRK